MNSTSLCSLAGRYDNTIPPRFLAPIDSLKIPTQDPQPWSAGQVQLLNLLEAEDINLMRIVWLRLVQARHEVELLRVNEWWIWNNEQKTSANLFNQMKNTNYVIVYTVKSFILEKK